MGGFRDVLGCELPALVAGRVDPQTIQNRLGVAAGLLAFSGCNPGGTDFDELGFGRRE